jgi:hypothetical protein
MSDAEREKEYPPCSPMALEPHYSRHVSAMTSEGLHSKSAIAEQLALRDQRLDDLLRALEWATREPTVFGQIHRAAFRSLSGEAIAEWLISHAKEST